MMAVGMGQHRDEKQTPRSVSVVVALSRSRSEQRRLSFNKTDETLTGCSVIRQQASPATSHTEPRW
jgi:hypothetical protein